MRKFNPRCDCRCDDAVAGSEPRHGRLRTGGADGVLPPPGKFLLWPVPEEKN